MLVIGTRLLVSFPRQPARKLLIPPAKISNFTDREGNDVREAPHHSPR
ncbi:MAG TPA: hypothetical protein VJS13_12620 [Pyrinomonadaceae bacterium]|nr:hypothetical protein [Pyrinomonadaceae bacterium]